ncbi:MAG: 3-dehydroquinate synthase [Microscillaceae bacterium]|nr:3-dehydroquinate synthase [Microscillaceae bacterium]
MKSIQQEFAVSFRYETFFTEGLFKSDNPLFKNLLENDHGLGPHKFLVVIDNGVVNHHPNLQTQILAYTQQYPEIMRLVTAPIIVPGGEDAKNSANLVEYILKEIDECSICRHSYVVAIGGGAVLDMVGYAAAIAHRGVRLIRIPTTVLAQNDSGVGVKNGVNAFSKKNFLGTFKPPYAVINDADFLHTLDSRDWRSGISEAIKVALIKDAAFFEEIEQNTEKYLIRDIEAMNELIFRCAELHMDHIAGGDPFELGSSRPLDFGHWAAHKLESLTRYALRHGEAVAIGIALDVTYSYLKGLLSENEWQRVINLLDHLGFDVYHHKLSENIDDFENPACLLRGLEEFREHLGGQLTIMLIERIGHGLEVHEMDHKLLKKSVEILFQKQQEKVTVDEGL